MLSTSVLIANLIHKAQDAIEDEGIPFFDLPILRKTHRLCLAAFEVGVEISEDRFEAPEVLARSALSYLIWRPLFDRHMLDIKDARVTQIEKSKIVPAQDVINAYYVTEASRCSIYKNAGFTDEERGKFTELLGAGFVDTFRYLYPDAAGRYSWWSYMFNARANNAGWRIDYFLVSDRIKNKIIDARIDDTVLGSDHCPVVLEIDL